MTTLQERKEFVNKIRTALVMQNYGLKVEEDSYTPTEKVITFDNVEQLSAIRELNIRLNIYEVRGQLDKGYIEFPEAQRRIDYRLDDKDVNRCIIKLKKMSKRHCQQYIKKMQD